MLLRKRKPLSPTFLRQKTKLQLYLWLLQSADTGDSFQKRRLIENFTSEL